MAVHPATASAAPQVTGAIRQAAQSTGISFEYLLTTAKIESNFNPSAQASTSSAKGSNIASAFGARYSFSSAAMMRSRVSGISRMRAPSA